MVIESPGSRGPSAHSVSVPGPENQLLFHLTPAGVLCPQVPAFSLSLRLGFVDVLLVFQPHIPMESKSTTGSAMHNSTEAL